MLKDYLSKRNISIYELSKKSGVKYSTLNELVNNITNIDNCTIRTGMLIAKALNISMEELYDICVVRLELSDDTNIFRSNVSHRIVRDWKVFVKEMLIGDEIEEYWKREEYFNAFYLLASLDYLSKSHNLPIYNKFNYIRRNKLQEPIYPRDILMEARLRNIPLEHFKKGCIPEFLKYNIVEGDIFNAG